MVAGGRRGRILLWVGWPALVLVLGISVLHFARYRMGIEIYWRWSPAQVLPAMMVALLPPALFELARRSRALR